MRPLPTVLAAVLALAGAGAPALAQDAAPPEPDWRYRVVDVAGDDVLNIRDFPGTQSAIVGELAPDADDVIVAGTRVALDGSVWWQVVTADGLGWVNARHLEAVEGSQDYRETFPLQCIGTEPFWSARIADGEAVFEDPVSDPVTWRAGEMTHASGLIGRFAVAIEGEGAAGNLSAWRNPAFCSDGMSDREFPYEGILSAPDGVVYAGCCFRAAP